MKLYLIQVRDYEHFVMRTKLVLSNPGTLLEGLPASLLGEFFVSLDTHLAAGQYKSAVIMPGREYVWELTTRPRWWK